eukprot:gene5556-5611_t
MFTLRIERPARKPDGILQKFDIINGLGEAFGARRYLEICTPSTGFQFRSVKPSVFETRHRMLYNCPETHDDGMPVSFHTAAPTSHDLVRTLASSLHEDELYDIIFVDPFHEYLPSMLDLRGAMCLLKPDGVLVVHDCCPPDAATAVPTPSNGNWCGVTYKAFIDFVLGSRIAGYVTVNADFGCGVVFNHAAHIPAAWRGDRLPPLLCLEWALLREDDEGCFRFFEKHREQFLNLIAPAEFLRVFPHTENTADPVQPVARRRRLSPGQFARTLPGRVWRKLGSTGADLLGLEIPRRHA